MNELCEKPSCVAGGSAEVLAPDAVGRRRMRRVAVARATVSLRGAWRMDIDDQRIEVRRVLAAKWGKKSEGVGRRCKPEELRRGGEGEVENLDGVSIGRVGSTLLREASIELPRIAPPLLMRNRALSVFLLSSLVFSRNWFLSCVWGPKSNDAVPLLSLLR